mmetsp:Transcript_14498/g.38302  ORF Transcript_14498/g.38302 Transcript_14498/m.38302 type:complete len:221 (-) Transcript_14498:154-816(-)
MRFFVMICATVTSAPASLPKGRKKMLATECSRPIVTNIGMHDQMPRILPGTSAAEEARKMASETSQLHSTALIRLGSAAPAHFFVASAAATVAVPPLRSPASLIRWATVRQPAVLPSAATPKARNICSTLILPSSHAAVHSMKLPVISCPAACRMKMRPIGKMRPITRRCRSGPAFGSMPATVSAKTPPIATYMPPMNAWCSALGSGAFALMAPFSASAS